MQKLTLQEYSITLFVILTAFVIEIARILLLPSARVSIYGGELKSFDHVFYDNDYDILKPQKIKIQLGSQTRPCEIAMRIKAKRKVFYTTTNDTQKDHQKNEIICNFKKLDRGEHKSIAKKNN